MAESFKFRHGTAAEAAAANPVLAAGEPGYETDTGTFKIGDGSTAWADLPQHIDESGLSATYAPKVVLHPNVAADGATDDAPTIAASVAAGAGQGKPVVVVELPAGNIRLNTPTYLDDANNDLTYILRGQGTATKITLGPGLDDEFAFHVNEDATGTKVIDYPSHPRFVVQDLLIDGAASTSASFSRLNFASAVFERVRVKSVKYGATTVGYTDHMTFRNIHVQTLKTDGWLYYQQGTGDSAVFDSVNGGISENVAYLLHMGGASLRGGITGRYQFVRCHGVEVMADHHDSLVSQSGEQGVGFTIQESAVAFRGCWNHLGPTEPWVQIDDSLSNNQDGSDVLFDKCVFAHRMDTDADARAADVHVLDVNSQTRLRFSSCRGALWVNGTHVFDPSGVKVTAADGSLQAALDSWGHLLSAGDAEVFLNNDGWQVSPPAPAHQVKSLVKNTNAPVIYASSTTTNPAGTLTSGATYYYKMAVFDGALWSQESAEVSQTPASAGRAVQLNINPRVGPARLRIWRGTASGTYDRYVDLPLGQAAITRVWDQGAYIGGYPWITTGVPATPGGVSALLDGTILAGRRIVYRGGPPVLGTWAVGDLALHTAPSAGGSLGWVCVAAGTPGTWKSWGAISA